MSSDLDIIIIAKNIFKKNLYSRINKEKKSNLIRELDLLKENINKETNKLTTAKTKEANLEQLLDNAKTKFQDLTNSVNKDLGKINL